MRLALVFVLVACGSSATDTVEPAPVSTAGREVAAAPEDSQASLQLPLRRDVAATVSAPGVIRFVTSAIATVGLVVGAHHVAQNAGEPAPTCPRVTGSERAGTIEGGCTDARGNRIEGRVRFDASTEIATYEFEGWQLDRFRIDGTIRARSSRRPGDMSVQPSPQPRPPADDDWWIDIQAYAPLNSNSQAAFARSEEHGRAEAPAEEEYVLTRIDYEAHQRDKVYEGRGTFSIGGFGSFRAETRAEIVDNDICGSEAASGETILSTDDDQVRILYDGATDCDPTSTVMVERGSERQELAGVQCSASGRAALWPLLALLFVRRRGAASRAE